MCWRRRCLCTHILVNDGGEPPRVDDSGSLQVVHLPRAHHDVGNAGRAIGSVTAICQGFDALAYLDADNWYEPNHLETLAALYRASGADVCSSARNLYHPEGTLLGRCPEVDGERFVDTNCLFLTSAAFAVVAAWYLVPRGHVLAADREVWRTIKNRNLPARAHRSADGCLPHQLSRSLRLLRRRRPRRGEGARLGSERQGIVARQAL